MAIFNIKVFRGNPTEKDGEKMTQNAFRKSTKLQP